MWVGVGIWGSVAKDYGGSVVKNYGRIHGQKRMIVRYGASTRFRMT